MVCYLLNQDSDVTAASESKWNSLTEFVSDSVVQYLSLNTCTAVSWYDNICAVVSIVFSRHAWESFCCCKVGLSWSAQTDILHFCLTKSLSPETVVTGDVQYLKPIHSVPLANSSTDYSSLLTSRLGVYWIFHTVQKHCSKLFLVPLVVWRLCSSHICSAHSLYIDEKSLLPVLSHLFFLLSLP